MSENKTVKYHIPEQGIYLYARTSDEGQFHSKPDYSCQPFFDYRILKSVSV